MSGGSYDYLCYKEAEDILRCGEMLERMADTLAVEGFHDAAKETHDLRLECRRVLANIDARIDRLKDVWHAVEWWKSGDSNREVVPQAIAKYRGE